MKNNSKAIWSILLTVIIIGALVVGGMYVWNQYEKQEAANSNEQTLQDINTKFNANDLDGSIAAATAVASSSPSSVDALLSLALSYAQKGSLTFDEKTYGDKAIATAEQALAIDPNNSDAYRIIGYAYEIEGNYLAAMTNYNRSLSLNSQNADTYANRGHAYELQGNYASAMTDYQTALSLNPDLDQANIKIGELLAKEGSTTEASPYLSKVITLNTNFRFKAEASNDLGVISLHDNDASSALQYFTHAITYDPTLAVAYVNRAQARLALHAQVTTADFPDFAKSVVGDLQTAIIKDPNLTSAYMSLAQVAFISGDKKTSTALLLQAQKVVDSDISLDANLKATTKVEITKLLALVK